MKTNGQRFYEAAFPATNSEWDNLPASAKFDYEQKAADLTETAVKERTVALQNSLAKATARIADLEANVESVNGKLFAAMGEVTAITSDRDQLKGQVTLLQQQLAAASTPATPAP